MRAILIDDEDDARALLRTFLTNYCSWVDICGEFKNPIDGFAYMKEHHKDLDVVYVDISMPEMDGLTLVSHCTEFELQVIFVTAYNEFAIEAIRLSALDYILKPIDIQALVLASEKAEQRIAQRGNYQKQLDNFVSNQSRSVEDKKLVINTSGELYHIRVLDLLYIAADGNYCEIYTCDGKKIVVSERIGEYEKKLNLLFFYRTHRSYLVNLKEVVKFVKGKDGKLQMSDGQEVPVSERKRSGLLKRLKLNL